MTDGVKDFAYKNRVLKDAAQFYRNQAKYLHPEQHKDGVSEARRRALVLERIADEDLEELNRLKRRQQPAGALR